MLFFKANLSQGAFLGHLDVTANFEGAAIYVDDPPPHKKPPWGRAPHSGLIEPGEHKGWVEAPGHTGRDHIPEEAAAKGYAAGAGDRSPRPPSGGPREEDEIVGRVRLGPQGENEATDRPGDACGLPGQGGGDVETDPHDFLTSRTIFRLSNRRSATAIASARAGTGATAGKSNSWPAVSASVGSTKPPTAA